TPEVWSALPRLGLPGDPRALRQLLGLPSPPSLLDRRHEGVTLRDLGRRLGRSGAGGPSIRRVLDGASAVTVHSGSPSHVPASRALAARSLGGLGRDAVAVLVALAEEAEHPLESLAAAMDHAAATDPDGVLAEVLSLAPSRARPVRTWDARGELHHVTGPVVLLGLAIRATPRDRPTDPGLAPLAESALAGTGFHGELIGWFDRLPEAERVRWIDEALTRRPHDWSGRALARGLEVLPDASIVAHLPHLDPIDVVSALPPRRVAALAPALAERTRGFLAERRRWMRDAVRQEHDRLAAALRTKGSAALRAWRAADPTPPVALPAEPRRTAAPTPTAAADAVARAVVDLVLEEPLLGWLLGRIERELGETTPTMGLRVGPGPRVALVVNPGWFCALAQRVRVGALRHEVLHLLFGHPFRTSLASVDLDAYGTAADLVVNEHPGRWPLPGDARRMPFGSPPLPPDGTLDGWYAALLERRFLSDTALGGVWHSDHRMWREPAGSTAPDATEAGAAMDGLVAEGVEALAGDALWGLDPGLHAAVLGAVERHRSTLDWRRALRTFAASSRRTVVRPTLKRRSRRYGTFPGTRIRRLHRVAVAIDTSGSISLALLHTFFAEVAAMSAAGTEVVVVECDAAVQKVWAYTGQPPEEVHGRGGTAFEPVMRWLHGDVGRFDGLVYLTDGKGPAPTTRPPCAVLWVVAPLGDTGPHLRFGRAVKIPPRSDDLGSRRR
ncbi:MAG: VWA-like domain-containing protein, partial [Myxococcota bacterium]